MALVRAAELWRADGELEVEDLDGRGQPCHRLEVRVLERGARETERERSESNGMAATLATYEALRKVQELGASYRAP